MRMRVSLGGLVSDIYEKLQDANDLGLLYQDSSSRSISIIKRYRSKLLERIDIIRSSILSPQMTKQRSHRPQEHPSEG